MNQPTRDSEFAAAAAALRAWRGRQVLAEIRSCAADSTIAVLESVVVHSVEDVPEEDRFHPGDMLCVVLADGRGQQAASLVIAEELYLHEPSSLGPGELDLHLAGVRVCITGTGSGGAEEDTDGSSQWTEEQRQQALELLDRPAWGDVDGEIRTMEESLRLAIEATHEAFLRWEDGADSEGFVDEYSLSPRQVDELSPEWRIAYVARLVRSVALMYGIETEFSQDPALFTSLLRGGGEGRIAELLHGLNDIQVGIHP